MRTLDLILYFVTAACFGLAVKSATTATPARINWLALGLLAWVLVPLISTIRAS